MYVNAFVLDDEFSFGGDLMDDDECFEMFPPEDELLTESVPEDLPSLVLERSPAELSPCESSDDCEIVVGGSPSFGESGETPFSDESEQLQAIPAVKIDTAKTPEESLCIRTSTSRNILNPNF